MILTGLLLAGPSAAQPPRRFELSVGGFGVGEGKRPVLETGLEAHLKPFPVKIGRFEFHAQPTVGFSLTEREGHWVYAGVSCEVPWGSRWWVSPAFAVAHYARGEGARLGSELQFRSSIELAMRVGERFEVGLELYHLSNGRTASKNPGSESLLLTLSAPFSR